MALAIASFREDLDINSGIHLNPSLISGRDSEPDLSHSLRGLKCHM